MSDLLNNNSQQFDEYSQKSILKYAKRLEGKTLREFLSKKEIDLIEANILAKPGNKGKLGHHIEKFYFKYDLNSASEADFPCDLELKVTPIKYIKNVFDDIKETKQVYREIAILRRLSSMDNNIFTIKLLDVVLPWVKNKKLPSGIFIVTTLVN